MHSLICKNCEGKLSNATTHAHTHNIFAHQAIRSWMFCGKMWFTLLFDLQKEESNIHIVLLNRRFRLLPNLWVFNLAYTK